MPKDAESNKENNQKFIVGIVVADVVLNISQAAQRLVHCMLAH